MAMVTELVATLVSQRPACIDIDSVSKTAGILRMVSKKALHTVNKRLCYISSTKAKAMSSRALGLGVMPWLLKNTTKSLANPDAVLP